MTELSQARYLLNDFGILVSHAVLDLQEEQIWKSLKREISPIFVETKEEFLDLIRDTFDKLSRKLSFAEWWIGEFLPGRFKNLSS